MSIEARFGSFARSRTLLSTATCFWLFIQPCTLGAQTAPAAGIPYRDELVTADIPYSTSAGKALVRSFLQPPGARRGIYLELHGYNPTPVEPCQVGSPRLNIEKSASNLQWRLGFDIHEVIWCVGDDYIQRNAYVAVKLIERYKAELKPGEKFVLEGTSMGGLVARYALDYMESRAITHSVSLFISYDSPQMGAYIPVGVQFASRYFRDLRSFAESKGLSSAIAPLAPLADLLAQVDRPAPRQMLVTYYSNGLPSTTLPGLEPVTVSRGISADRQRLLQELSDMGDYPKAPGLRTVAIANGAGWGRRRAAPLDSGAPQRGPDTISFSLSPAFTKRLDFSVPFSVLGLTLWTLPVRAGVGPRLTLQVRPLTATGEQTVFDAKLGFVLSLNNVSIDLAGLLDRQKSLTFLRSAADVPTWVPDAFLLGAVGQILAGVRELIAFPNEVQHRVFTQIPYDLVSGGLGTNGALQLRNNLNKNDNALGTATGGNYHEMFIPTTSALGLDLPPGTDLTGIPDLKSPRFHRIYYSPLDYDHVSQTPPIQSLLCQEHHRVLGLPYIDSIDPSYRASQNGAFTMMVNGENFSSSTKVYVRGQETPTAFVSSSRLRANVPPLAVPGAPNSGPFSPPPSLFAVSLGPDPSQPGPTGCPATLAIQPSPLTFDPTPPTTAGETVATYSGDWTDSCVPAEPNVSRSGNLISISAKVPSSRACLFAITPYTLQAHLGQLPAGNYQVVVTATAGSNAPQQLARETLTVQLAPPQIAAVAPASVPAGGEGLTIIVEGSQFVQGQSAVLWNGRAVPTQFVSGSQLQAAVPAADLAQPGIAQIAVSTASSASPGVSGTLPFTITQALPVLTALSRASAAQGSPGFALTANGRFFTAESVLEWAGNPLPTRFLSTTTLQADISATLLATPGSFAISVVTGAHSATPQLFHVERTGGNGPSVTTAVNAASFAPCLSRGSIGTLYGTGFSNGTEQASSVPLPPVLADVHVLVGIAAAPLYYVSPTQINFQVPSEVPLGRTSVQVVTNGVAGPTSDVDILDYALGVFQYRNAAGELAPIITDSSYRLITPENPAQPGGYITVWATGIGAVQNAPANGEAAGASPPATALVSPLATISGGGTSVTAAVLFAGLAPGQVGLAQINIQLPASLPAGPDRTLAIRFGESSGVTIPLPAP